eukprot:170709-Rhodomonas_salina.3
MKSTAAAQPEPVLGTLGWSLTGAEMSKCIYGWRAAAGSRALPASRADPGTSGDVSCHSTHRKRQSPPRRLRQWTRVLAPSQRCSDLTPNLFNVCKQVGGWDSGEVLHLLCKDLAAAPEQTHEPEAAVHTTADMSDSSCTPGTSLCTLGREHVRKSGAGWRKKGKGEGIRESLRHW